MEKINVIDVSEPKHDWTCTRCKKDIEIAFSYKLCNECLDEFLIESERVSQELNNPEKRPSLGENVKLYMPLKNNVDGDVN